MDGPIYHLEKVVKARSEEREDFNGPLDLILHLLSKNKMEIKDIQISLILEQYLAWMDRRRELDLDVASEFVTMAAQLVFIKTRMLLSIRDEEALSEMEQLIASLEEHQRRESLVRVRAVLPVLEGRFTVGRDYLVKTPEPLPARSYAYSPTTRRNSAGRCWPFSPGGRAACPRPWPLSRASWAGSPTRWPTRPTRSSAAWLRRGWCAFRALFRGSRSRSEVVATFLAVLELCKARRVFLAGDQSECTVTAVEGEVLPEPSGRAAG